MPRVAILSALLLAALAACSGAAGTNGTNGRSTLVLIVAEPAGTHCADGGVAIEQGFDTNGNGILDASEVDAAETQYVCNGATGAMGGTGTTGGSGDAGPSGYNTLVTVTAVAAGPSSACVYGGERIDTGLDTNRDGTLESTEITSTTYVCEASSLDGYHFGDVHLSQASDLDVLDGVKVLVGTLYVDGFTGAALSLPTLQQVAGNIVFSGDEDVGVRAEIAGLTSVSFPALTEVTEIDLAGQPDLASISMPALATAERLDFEDNPLVTTLDLSGLVDVRSGLTILRHPLLTALSFPNLSYLGDLDLESLAALGSLSFPVLTTANNTLTVYGTGITSFSAALLTTAAEVDFEGNGSLTSFSMPKMSNVTNSVEFEGNEQLDTCAIYRFLGQLKPVDYDIEDDGTANTCAASDYMAPITVSGIGGSLSFSLVGRDYPDAELACQALGTGGHLIWFESAAEWTAFSAAAGTGLFQSDSWVGYTDAVTDGTWLASSGFTDYNPAASTAAGGDFWSPTEPNGGTNENCAEIYASGLVNDSTCNNVYSFICRVSAAQ